MRYGILQIVWLVSDALLFVMSFALAYFLRVGWILSTDFPFDKFLIATLLVTPVWLLLLLMTRTFHLTRNQFTLRNALYISYASLVGVAFFTLTYYFQYTTFFSRLLLIYAFFISTIIVFFWHVLFEQIRRRILRRDPPSFPTLIVGITRESKELISKLNTKKNPLKPVAILDARGTSEQLVEGVPFLGKLNKLEEVLSEKKITHVIQCSDLEQSMNLLSACRNRGIHYILLPSVLGMVERDEGVASLEGLPVTMVNPKKGLLDIVFG